MNNQDLKCKILVKENGVDVCLDWVCECQHLLRKHSILGCTQCSCQCFDLASYGRCKGNCSFADLGSGSVSSE